MERVEDAVHKALLEGHLTLSTAESCTGGALAARLTEQPGASNYFLGSIVAYSNALKRRLLGVQEATLEQFGAVSEQTVIEMARGALVAMESDYSVATTGIAGPTGGSEGKPVGTVWIGIANRSGSVLTWELHCRGSRTEVIEWTVNAALNHLWQVITTF